VPERARLDIFERVNGGVPLTRQQMRNCLFMGLATRFLKEESTTVLFKKATGHSLPTSTMRDREFVNRFCAFQILPLEKYRGYMDDFLAEALKKMNSMDANALNKLSSQFRISLNNNYYVFKRHAFRKSNKNQYSRSVLNASLWDIMSTGLSRYPEHVVEAHANELREAFFKLMADDDFMKSITIGTNELKKVRYRFKATKEMFEEVFNDYQA
jgi:hypothetical protein